MTLAIIFTIAVPVGFAIAVKSGGAWSRTAVSNSDMALGFAAGMAAAAVCEWAAWLI